ncbi:hypothetical protein QJS66_03380 [Kocuria rhizophila]|nr:hypothetical protein QJS66_03380 [Kocuria rhizophila]
MPARLRGDAWTGQARGAATTTSPTGAAARGRRARRGLPRPRCAPRTRHAPHPPAVALRPAEWTEPVVTALLVLTAVWFSWDFTPGAGSSVTTLSDRGRGHRIHGDAPPERLRGSLTGSSPAANGSSRSSRS